MHRSECGVSDDGANECASVVYVWSSRGMRGFSRRQTARNGLLLLLKSNRGADGGRAR
jgi:hypothetical protein